MEKVRRVLITIAVGIVLITSFYLITQTISRYTGYSIVEEDGFGECLKNKDLKLYINTENSAEVFDRMEVLGYLQYFSIVNCEGNKNNQVCLEKELDDFPTWIIENKISEGELSIKELSEYSVCEL